MAARFFAALFKEACAMAASPVSIVPASNSNLRRRPLALTQRRLEANRRNAGRSSGPRTAEGKARVARNAIKHGFFAGQERWTSLQHRDFAEILAGLRDEFKPDGAGEESCVSTIAESYVRMAAMLRYENVAALKHHQQRDRELNQHIRDGRAGGGCAFARASGKAPPRRFMAADHPRTARGKRDHPVYGLPAPDNSTCFIRAGRIEKHEDWRSFIGQESAETNPLFSGAEGCSRAWQ
jgi:hypothetical protein